MSDRIRPGFFLRTAAVGLPFLAAFSGCGDNSHSKLSQPTTFTPVEQASSPAAETFTALEKAKKEILASVRAEGYKGAVIMLLNNYKPDLNVNVILGKKDASIPGNTFVSVREMNMVSGTHPINDRIIGYFPVDSCAGDYQLVLSPHGGDSKYTFLIQEDNGRTHPSFRLDSSCSITLDLTKPVKKMDTATATAAGKLTR